MHKFHKQIFLLSIIGIISAVNIQPAAAFEKTDTTNRVLLSPAALSINADKSYSRPLFYGERQKRLDKLTSKEWFKMTSVSVPLILSGIAVEWAKQPVNDLRNAYVPNFRHKYDAIRSGGPYARAENRRGKKPQFVGTHDYRRRFLRRDHGNPCKRYQIYGQIATT